MADKQGKLAKLLEQEYKSKGIVGGALSATGKRFREMFDLRNLFFSGGGVGSVIGRKIFGKGYSATPESGDVSKISNTAAFSPESIEIFSSIKKDTRISARNSVVLPAMARDMNIMKQNISKLVKLQGGTATNRADMFFKRASERELAYESQFGKKQSTNTNVTPVKEGKSDSSIGIAGLLGSLLVGLGSLLKGLFNNVTSVITTLASEVGNLVSKIVEMVATLVGLKFILNKLNPFGNPRIPTPTPSAPGSSTKPGGTTGSTRPVPTPGVPGTPGQTPSQQPSTRNGRGRPSIKPSQRYGNVGSGGLKVVTSGTESKRGQLFKKFLAVVEKRMGKAVAGKLAGLAASLLVPGIGWVFTLIGLGFLASDAWAIYKIWQEVSGETDTSPTNLKDEQMAMAHLIYDRFREAGFSDAQARGAVANAIAESSLNPNAHNEKGEDSVGLFQINRNGILGKGYSVEQLKDPETNIKIAIEAAKKSPMFKSASTMEEATEGFMKQVENPADQSSAAIQKRVNFGLAMQSSNLGSKINGISTDVVDAGRTLSRGEVIVNSPVNTNVQNNNNVQGGGGVSSTFNDQFNELLKLSMLNS